MEFNKYHRLKQSNNNLDSQEKEWWEKFSEVEEKYCWVQNRKIQKIIRGSYVKQIKKLTNTETTILELGCGVGWLIFLLAEAGAKNLVGTDFSKKQIERAKQELNRKKELQNKNILFFEGDYLSIEKILDKKFDLVICHAFLHHLTEQEINMVFETAHRSLKPQGKLVLIEPVRYSLSPLPTKTSNWVMRFTSYFRRGERFGRKFNKKERLARDLINLRQSAPFPNGPSPKELPFCEHELEEYSQRYFCKIRNTRLFSFSHLIGQELLLFQESHPIIGKLIAIPVLTYCRLKELFFLKKEYKDSTLWIFELFLFRKIN